jgi:hypothetical protein
VLWLLNNKVGSGPNAPFLEILQWIGLVVDKIVILRTDFEFLFRIGFEIVELNH